MPYVTFSHTIALFQRVGIAILVFTTLRGFFYFFNISFFPDMRLWDFVQGLRFDIAAIVFLYLPFLLFHLIPLSHKFRNGKLYGSVLKNLFHLSNTSAILLNCIDLEYYKFTLKRITFDIFGLIGSGKDFFTLLPQFMLDYWYLGGIIAVLIIISEWLYRKTETAFSVDSPAPLVYYSTQSCLSLLIAVFFLILARGGIQLKPIGIIDAGQHTLVRNIPLVLNSPFTLIKTYNHPGVEKKDYFNKEVIDTIFTPVQHYQPKNNMKKHNVLIIVLESFSSEYIGSMNANKGYTPFLDSLIGEGLLFENCFANARKSMEGIPAIISSLPALMNSPYITSPYSGNEINSLASLLNKTGYRSSFFHGGTNGTMGLEGYSRTAGFDRYIGRDQYDQEEDYDGNWGIYDEPFFQFTARELNREKQPFFSLLFSLSSHHPYSIPQEHQGKFQPGKHKIIPTIQYTDYALRHFFSTASQMPWFDNTLFVITADHTAAALSKEYATDAGVYRIPLLFYKPGPEELLTGRSSEITQQADILPSVLDFLHYPHDFVAFGESVFAKDRTGFSISYINNIYQLIHQNYVYQFDGTESIALYNLSEDHLLKKNIYPEHLQETEKHKRLTKAIIQQYNNRLIENRFFIE